MVSFNSSKSLTCLFFALCIINTISFAQNNIPQHSSIDLATNELAAAVKNSHDCSYISGILKKSQSYDFNKDGSLNALESAYFWGNDTAFECVLEYLFRQKDTLAIQNSKVLGMLVYDGDTLNMKKLLSLYSHRMTNSDKIEIIHDFVDFIQYYDLINAYRSGFANEEEPLSTTIDYDFRVAEILTRYGIDFNLQDEDGWNIMFYCMESNALAKYFVEGEQKIDLNTIDNERKSFLQYYVEKVSKPERVSYAYLEANEKETRYYAKRIDLLNYYISAGATVGPEHKNGWKYLMEKLKSVENPFLSDFIRATYSEYIK